MSKAFAVGLVLVFASAIVFGREAIADQPAALHLIAETQDPPPPKPDQAAKTAAADARREALKKNPPLEEQKLDVAPVPPSTDPIVLFASPPPETELKDAEDVNKWHTSNLLHRELYRQGVLLAARDELGRTPRDESLGELAPADLPATNRIAVDPRFGMSEKHRIAIDRGPADARKPVWHAAMKEIPIHDDDLLGAVTAAEAFSRKEFVTALKRAGLTGTANKVKATAPPKEDDPRLVRPTLTAQFAAVRDLHAAVRADGESPATLFGLARAYANLGMLTDRLWDHSTWVFKARGLLYAERLRQRDPKAPWGHWARAYAAALAGMHATALADLAEAGRVRGDTPAPAWVPLIDGLCRFDTAALHKAAEAGPLSDLAGVFEYATVESWAGAQRALDVGAAVVAKVPDCYRVHDSMADMGGVRSQHTTTLAGFTAFTKTFRDRVGELPGVPAAATGLAADAPEPDFVKALAEAGRPRDERSEPSWAALAHLARETRVVQVERRLYFLRRALGVPVDDFWDEVKPLVAGHPAYPFLETYTLDPARQRDDIAAKVRAVKLPPLSFRQSNLATAVYQLGADEKNWAWNVRTTHAGDLYYDMYLLLRQFAPADNASPIAAKALEQSPYAPLARAMMVTHDWKYAEPKAAAWEKEAQHPELLLALTRRALGRNRAAEAEGLAARAIKVSPDVTSYRLLAQTHKVRGDEAKWLETLERYLKEPDPGLSHGQVRVEIANHFMAKKDFERAKPYAEAAADTGAAWAMRCAGRCAEGLADWETAEGYARAETERYDVSYYQWFFWCLRTGRGDLATARQGVEAVLQRGVGRRSSSDVVVQALLHTADKEPAKALSLYVAVYQQVKNENVLLVAALEADALGDTARRDRVFADWPAKTAYGPLLTLFKGRLKKGEKDVPTRAAIEEALKQVPADVQAQACYAVGRFLQTRGEKELAKEYLARCGEKIANPNSLEPVLAAMALRELTEKK